MRRDGKVAPSILISMQDNQLSIPDILDPLFPRCLLCQIKSGGVAK